MPIDLIQKINIEVDSPKLVKLTVNTFMPHCLGNFSDCQITLWLKTKSLFSTLRGNNEQKLPLVIFSNDRFYNSSNPEYQKEKTFNFNQGDFSEKVLPEINALLDKYLFNEQFLSNNKEEYVIAYGKLGHYHDFGYKITGNDNEFTVGLCPIYYPQ